MAYAQEELSGRLVTLCRTDHQGFHEVKRAEARLNADGGISLFFPPPLPAYWLGLELVVKDGLFQARPYGTPLTPGKISFEVTRQELILQKNGQAQDVIINGCASINFIQREADGQSAPYFFTGCFSAMIYRGGEDRVLTPELLEFIAAQDLGAAVYELGEPLRDAGFTAREADAFRSAVLGSKISPRTEIREVTWDISPTSGLNDAGKERLSIWYTRQGDQWFPVANRVWNKGDASFPVNLGASAN